MDDSPPITPPLIDVPATPLPPRSAGVFSGALFRKSRPEAFARVTELLSEGVSVRTIIKQIGDEFPRDDGAALSGHTVLAIKRLQLCEIATRKAALADQSLDNADLAGAELQRRLLECPSAIETTDLIKLQSSSIDKGLLLAGEATERLDVQVKVGADPSLVYVNYLALLRSSTGGVGEKDRAEKTRAVIEVHAEPVPGCAAPAADLVPPGASVDSESIG